jgi:N6-L-threonylcarbamoyladenine synthase
MLMLGIETSCDETGVALVDASARPPRLLAHALHSQIAAHAPYGGVVPELASRDHIQRLVPLTQQVLDQAGVSAQQVGAVAVTAGPGLAGALLVGTGFATGLAEAWGVPLMAVHHLEGHLLSPFIGQPELNFPFLALLVSGGHTQLMAVHGVGRYQLLGQTIDDAAGEAFDKSAKLLGLPYPGGPALADLAQQGNACAHALPRPLLHQANLDFSFAGLKTAVATRRRALGELPQAPALADLAASTQAAIVDVLVEKSRRALQQTGLTTMVVAGGVGANRALREALNAMGHDLKVSVHYPDLAWCTDNGAMIAWAAAMRWQAGLANLAPARGLPVQPRWALATTEAP